MDGIIEPVILVLGHPIAGNPSQFALERALDELDLQWRVLSCDVPPHRLEQAIEGAEVLGFRGLLLDRNLLASEGFQDVQHDFYQRRTASEAGDESHGKEAWHSESLLSQWLEAEIRHHFEQGDAEIGPLLWIGNPVPGFPNELATERTQSPIAWAPEASIVRAKLIAVSQPVDVSQWPQGDPATLVVDFADAPNDVEQLRRQGYTVVDQQQIRIGVLMMCLQRLTGKRPEQEVLTEAIEEYLAV